MSNPTLDLLNRHRSIRRYTDQALSPQTIQTLVEAAQMAPTSGFIQAYSIIGVTDPAQKRALREISGQMYVEENGHLFVFVADYYRHHVIAKDKQEDFSRNIGNTEGFIVATVDTALAAQSMTVAAESMGLGTCYIGSLRNNLQQVIDILQLPKYTYPIFGLVVGYPAHEGSQKERLPFAEIYHENHYDSNESSILTHLAQYDEHIEQYYKTRDSAARLDNWSAQVKTKMTKRERQEVGDIVRGQGFLRHD